jgi:hypothetical protein
VRQLQQALDAEVKRSKAFENLHRQSQQMVVLLELSKASKHPCRASRVSEGSSNDIYCPPLVCSQALGWGSSGPALLSFNADLQRKMEETSRAAADLVAKERDKDKDKGKDKQPQREREKEKEEGKPKEETKAPEATKEAPAAPPISISIGGGGGGGSSSSVGSGGGKSAHFNLHVQTAPAPTYPSGYKPPFNDEPAVPPPPDESDMPPAIIISPKRQESPTSASARPNTDGDLSRTVIFRLKNGKAEAEPEDFFKKFEKMKIAMSPS